MGHNKFNYFSREGGTNANERDMRAANPRAGSFVGTRNYRLADLPLAYRVRSTDFRAKERLLAVYRINGPIV